MQLFLIPISLFGDVLGKLALNSALQLLEGLDLMKDGVPTLPISSCYALVAYF